MLQISVAYYQLISSHPTSCIAVCWRLDDPDPFLQGPPIPQGGGGLPLFFLYPKHITTYLTFPSVIVFDLAFNIWS